MIYTNHSIKERRLSRVKLPIAKSSKHGTCVLQIKELIKQLIILSGDEQLLPGPTNRTKEPNNSTKLDLPENLKSNMKVAHLNIRSLKSTENYHLLKDALLVNNISLYQKPDETVSDSYLQIED